MCFNGLLAAMGRFKFKPIGRLFKSLESSPPYCRNAISTVFASGGRERAKPIDIRKHFAHEVIQNRQMRLIKVDTSQQIADMLTKALVGRDSRQQIADMLTSKGQGKQPRRGNTSNSLIFKV